MEILKLINVKKSYKNNIAVDGISFEVNRKDVFGLIGSNGAGKSTTISMIATIMKPDSGDILFDDINIIKKPQNIRARLGYIPQDISLYYTLTGIDNLKFFGKLYRLQKTELDQRIEEVRTILEIPKAKLQDKVATYSGGMKRRLNIGVSLLHKPELIIMDEPTVGIDVSSRNQILETIRTLSSLGSTILYTGHHMEEIELICNKLCIMEQGKIVALGEKQELLKTKTKNINLEELYLSTISKIDCMHNQ